MNVLLIIIMLLIAVTFNLALEGVALYAVLYLLNTWFGVDLLDKFWGIYGIMAAVIFLISGGIKFNTEVN